MPSVYIGSFSRGKPRPKVNGAVCVNVTSCQGRTHPDRLAFSPMHLGPITDGGDGLLFKTFEGWWQGQKRYRELDHIHRDNSCTEKYQQFRQTIANETNPSILRHPKGTKTKEIVGQSISYGKTVNRYKRLSPIDAIYHGQLVDGYVNSRKIGYVPNYYNLISGSSQLQYYIEKYNVGNDIVVYDLDGPKDDKYNNILLPVSLEMLQTLINDTRHPFGHGYVVAAAILGLNILEICK